MARISKTFTGIQFQALSEIARDIGQVFFATLVVPLFFGLEKSGLYLAIIGIIMSLAFWSLGVWLIKGVK